MATDPHLPGSGVPLDPNIQEALDDFNRNKMRRIREAAEAVLFEDLKEDIRDILKNRGQ